MYKANIPTYDHYLIVNDVNKFKTKEKLDKAYRNACIELERYNIKALFYFKMRHLLDYILESNEYREFEHEMLLERNEGLELEEFHKN